MEKFPIGFWNYTITGSLGAKDVQDWEDLGMTLAMSPSFYDGCDPEKMTEILDACAEKDIKVIVCDGRTSFWGASDNKEEYEKKFRAAYELFGKHPAVFGFHVGDEPTNKKGFEDCIFAHNTQLRIAPELTPHLNFLPYWEGQEQTILGTETFVDWAKYMAKEANLKILCYDCYVQMNPNNEGLDQYFQNLRKFSEAADVTGITPWTTLLSVGHFRYRVPNEDDLRWQLNTAVASGMRGILWFFVYERAPMSNYRLPPIDEFGERTETFPRMSRVNRHFQKQFGEFFMKAQHVATYHTVKAYGGYPLYEAEKTDDILLDVTCDQKLPAVVSFFLCDGHKHVAVVNNSLTENGLFKLHIKKDAMPVERLNWNRGYDQMKVARGDAYYDETETEQVGGDWLAPGQMKVYRLN